MSETKAAMVSLIKAGKRAIDRIQKAVSGFDGIRRKSGREESGKYFV